MAAEPELKPCPFCGGIAMFCNTRKHPYVACRRCGAQTLGGYTEAEAANNWNCRTPLGTEPCDGEQR